MLLDLCDVEEGIVVVSLSKVGFYYFTWQSNALGRLPEFIGANWEILSTPPPRSLTFIARTSSGEENTYLAVENPDLKKNMNKALGRCPADH